MSILSKEQEEVLSIVSKMQVIKLSQLEKVICMVFNSVSEINDDFIAFHVNFLETGGYIEISDSDYVKIKGSDKNINKELIDCFEVYLALYPSIDFIKTSKGQFPTSIIFINENNDICEMVKIEKSNIVSLNYLVNNKRNENSIFIFVIDKYLFEDNEFKEVSLRDRLSMFDNFYIALIDKNSVEFVNEF